MIWWRRTDLNKNQRSNNEEQRRRTEEEHIWVGDWTIWVWFARRTQKIMRKKKWNSSEVLNERLPMRGDESFLPQMRCACLRRWVFWCPCLSQVGVCMFGCESVLESLLMGFLMSALVLGWGLYVWVWECSGLDAEVVKYDHKSRFRNLISTYRNRVLETRFQHGSMRKKVHVRHL